MMKEMILAHKWRISLASLLWLGTIQYTVGQCPSSEEVTVQLSSKQEFSQDQGRIIFSFKSASVSDLTSFRVRLYDTDKKQYVYDDNNPAFLNQVSAPAVSSRELTFINLATARYELELHGGECQYQRYQIPITRE